MSEFIDLDNYDLKLLILRANYVWKPRQSEKVDIKITSDKCNLDEDIYILVNHIRP